MLSRPFACLLALVLATGLAQSQIQASHVQNLPVRTAASRDSAAVLAASLETILNDSEVCCGKNSSLGDIVQGADPASLKDLAAKLQRRHLLEDGRPITVTAEYLPANSIDSDRIIASVMKNQALLMQWNSHLYVLDGVLFNEEFASAGNDGGGSQRYNAILKLSLIDVRFSDARRHATFNRATDDWKSVQGLLMVSVAR